MGKGNGRPVILQVSKLYTPWIGGIEKVVQDIAEGICDEFESEVLVCQPRGRGLQETVNGVRVTRATSVGMVLSQPLSPGFPLLMRRLSRHADIVHIHLPFPLATIGWRRNKGCRLVVTYHSDIIRQEWLSPVYGRWLRRVLEDAALILVSSPNMVRSSRWLRPYEAKCRVVPFFVDLRNFPLGSNVEVDPRELGFEREIPIVLFVGRLVYYKGLEYLLRAMQQVNARLVIVGDGPLRRRMERLSRELGVDKKVQFVGRVANDLLHKYYRVCRCLVLPSVEPSEAFGLVQLEAMAYGKPVVNTNLPTGVPFVSIDGETGFTVEPRDVQGLAAAISRLCDDDVLWRRMSQEARRRVETVFNKDVVLTQIKSIYWDVLSGGVANHDTVKVGAKLCD